MSSTFHDSSHAHLALVSMEDVPFFHLWGGNPTVRLRTWPDHAPLKGSDAKALGLQAVEVARQSSCRIVTVDLTGSRAERSFCERIFPLVRKAGLKLAVKIDADLLQELIPPTCQDPPAALCLVWPFGPLDEDTAIPQLGELLSGWDETHVELVTAIPQEDATPSSLSNLVRRIAAYDPETPWHLVRWPEETSWTEDKKSSLNNAGLVAFFRKARRALQHVYLENLPLSRWLDTICPDCGTPCAERIALRRDRTFLSASRLDPETTCPTCARNLGFEGGLCVPDSLPAQQRDPRTGFVSIGNWEAPLDLGSGRPKSDATINPMYGPARDHPFPTSPLAVDEWVFTMAHHAVSRYSPNLLVLHTNSLTDPVICASANTREKAANKLEELVETLIAKTGYQPLVLGFGNPTPTAPIPPPSANAVVVADERIACYYGDEDLQEVLASTPNVERVLSRQQMSQALGTPLDSLIYGDTFAIAAPENRFASTLLQAERACVSTDRDGEIPIWHDKENIGGLWELREAVASRVLGGEHIAIILIEGLGVGSFCFSEKKLRCHPGDIPLSTSMLLSTLSAGQVHVPYEFIPPPWAIRTLSNPLSLGLPFDRDRLTFDVMNTGKYVAVISGCSGRTHRLFPGQICVEPVPAIRDIYATLVACP